MTRRTKWLFLVLMSLLAFNAAALTILTIARRSSAAAVSGRVVTTGIADIGGPFSSMTTDGKTVTDQTSSGKWMVIYFGYTSCPDACPTALSNMGVALEKLGKDASNIQPLFITVDPERDTRQVMSAYLESFDHRIVGLVGTGPQTDTVVKAYHVYIEPHKEQGADYLIDHSAYFYVMGPDGKFVDVIEGATPGEQIAGKLRELMDERST